MRKKLACVLSLGLFVSAAVAEDATPQKTYEERKADLKVACDACAKGVKKDPGEWDLSVAMGFNLTQGNADTTLLTGQAKALREIENDIYNLELNGAFGKQESVDTQRYIRADAGYKRLFEGNWYGTGSIGFLADDIAAIDYRLLLNPGLGYFLIKNEITSLSLESGPSYVFQKQGGTKDNFVAWRVANGYDWKISETAKIFQTTEYLLNVEETNDSLINAAFGIEASLTSKLALVWAIRDRYDNLPAPGLEKNDVAITSSLKVAL